MASVQGIYVALFGRPADPLGLAYFDEQTNNGADLTAIGDLSASAEYQDRFAGQSNTQIVNSIYNSLFNRDADLAGLAYFVEQLNSGAQDINSIAINILDGAQNDDLETVNNKIEAADHFTAALDTGTEVVAYQGDDAAQDGRDFLQPVTSDDATVQTQAEANTYIQSQIVMDSGTGEGNTFTLTDDGNTTTGGVDNIQGTSGDDTFRAVTDDALASSDILHGGSGTDTLNISQDAIDGTTAAPVIDGVEIINNHDTHLFASVHTLDLSDVTGADEISTHFDNYAGGADHLAFYTNASLDTTFGISEVSVTGSTAIDISFTADELAGDSTLKLALDNDGVAPTTGAGFGTSGSVYGVGLNANSANPDIEHVTVDVSADNNGSLNLFNADLESIAVTGDGNVAIGSTGANLTSVTSLDASASTGDVDFISSAMTDDYTAMGGSGDNNLDFSAVTDTSVDGAISGGAGMDTLIGGAGDDMIDGGTGADTMTGNGGDNTFMIDTTSIGVNGQDVITDFGAGGDNSLDFGGPDATAMNYAEVDSGASDYASALSAAETALQGNEDLQYVAVDDDTGSGNTYVFYDADGDHNLDSNGVDVSVQLTGVGDAGIGAGGIAMDDIVG